MDHPFMYTADSYIMVHDDHWKGTECQDTQTPPGMLGISGTKQAQDLCGVVTGVQSRHFSVEKKVETKKAVVTFLRGDGDPRSQQGLE